MATKFYYPEFRKKVGELSSFLHKHQQEMVQLNSITDPQLTQLNTLNSALNTIVTDAGWPKYRELG